MAKIEWHKGLNLGIKEIDDQHKMLVGYVNDVISAVGSGKSEAAVDKLLAQLREYTVSHFNAEEAFMKQIDYPQILEHQQLHHMLKGKVKSLQAARFHKENIQWEEVKELLADWLLEHILREDYKIALYAKKRGKGDWN